MDGPLGMPVYYKAMNRFAILGGITVLIIAAALLVLFIPAPSSPDNGGLPPAPVYSSHKDLVRVTSPANGARVSSPLIIRGQARGYWYFEATFPVEVQDSAGALVGQGYAQALRDWMTEEYVPFESTIILTTSPVSGTEGEIILRKDNPSGLPEHDDHLSVPIVFE